MRRAFVARLAFPLAVALIAAAVVAMGSAFYFDEPDALQFIVTSDAHYGLTRAMFRGHTNVDAPHRECRACFPTQHAAGSALSVGRRAERGPRNRRRRSHADAPVQWGESVTLTLDPRPLANATH